MVVGLDYVSQYPFVILVINIYFFSCIFFFAFIFQVMVHHGAITISGSNGHFELNAVNPMIASGLLRCLRLLGDASASFEKNCVRGIKANHQKISKLSHQEAALNLNMFTAEEFDELVVSMKCLGTQVYRF
ncbi:unnamed protein product [Musa textilis]